MDRMEFPTFANVPPVRDLAAAYDELVAVSEGRVRLYAALLAQQAQSAEDDGAAEDALVGRRRGTDATGRVFDTGEQIRSLAELEAQERDRLARLTSDGMRMAVGAHRALSDDVRTRRNRVAALSIGAFVDEIGLERTDPAVLRAAQRAAYEGMRASGCDEGDPDVEAGPALTADEQARARRDNPSELP